MGMLWKHPRLNVAAAAAKLLQSCPTARPHRQQPTRLSHPWDSPGKSTGVGCHFLLQCMKVKSLSCIWLFATPWTAAYQAPPSMGFSRQEYWSGVPLPSPYFTIYLYNSICFCVNWRYQYVTVTNQCLFSFEVKIYILQNVQTLSTNLPSFHKCIYMCNSNLYQHKDHYNHHRKFLYPPGPHSSDFSHRDYLCLF